MRVRDLHSVYMTRAVVGRPETKVHEAAARMAAANHGSLAVLADPDDRLIGIVTERDVMNKIVAVGRDATQVTVREIMTPDPVTVTDDMDVADVADLMAEHHIRHVPVLDGQGAYVGTVSIRDVVSFSLGEAAEKALGRRALFGFRVYQLLLAAMILVLVLLMMLSQS